MSLSDEEMLYQEQSQDIARHQLRAEMWTVKAAAHRKQAEFYRLRARVETMYPSPELDELEFDLSYAQQEEQAAAHCEQRASKALAQAKELQRALRVPFPA